MRRVLPMVCALASVLALAARAPAATTRPGFASPITLPGSDGGNEPSLAIDSYGVRYASWQAPGEFARSRDGVHFSNTGVVDGNALGDVTNATDATGALYNAQICGDQFALHTCLYRSTDGGKTWPVRWEPADMNPGASDRPWIDVYPHAGSEATPDQTFVYLEYHTFSPDDLVYVTVSSDGGRTFSAPHVVGSDTNAVNGSGCNTVPGGVAVDQRNGWVYAAWLSGNDVVSNATTGCNYSQIGPFDQAWVSVSKDHGQTWTSHLAWHGAFDAASKTGDNADKIFATLAVDTAHQIHVVLSVRHHDDPLGYVERCEQSSSCSETRETTDLYAVTSPDRAQHWTSPFKINRYRGSYFFPAIAAGSRGIVDAAYYRSPTLRPNDTRSLWYIGFSQIRYAIARVSGSRAVYARAPVVADVYLDRHVVHRGGICTFGLFCSAVPNANRSLADAIAIALDPAGGANVTWTDDAGSKRLVRTTCQSSGPSAYTWESPLIGCYRAVARPRATMST